MRGHGFLDVAQELRMYQGEKWDRTRIGRLYYGVYLEYRQFCIDKLGLVPQKFAREHRVVNDLIRTLDENAGDLLRELREARNQADYDLDVPPEDIAMRLAFVISIVDALMTQLELLRSSRNPNPSQ